MDPWLKKGRAQTVQCQAPAAIPIVVPLARAQGASKEAGTSQGHAEIAPPWLPLHVLHTFGGASTAGTNTKVAGLHATSMRENCRRWKNSSSSETEKSCSLPVPQMVRGGPSISPGLKAERGPLITEHKSHLKVMEIQQYLVFSSLSIPCHTAWLRDSRPLLQLGLTTRISLVGRCMQRMQQPFLNGRARANGRRISLKHRCCW